MARYIDADALIKEMQECKYANPCNDFQRGVNASVDIHITGIKHMTGADVVPKSEVAREIFEEIEKLAIYGTTPFGLCLMSIGVASFAELKKKYTEEE